MLASMISPCITTDKIDETRGFYVEYMKAHINFDCGWYIDLHFGNSASTLQFMSPQEPAQPLCNCAGLTYNFAVENVDEEHDRLVKAGIKPVMPLEDHPWGDRAFTIMDPNGIQLYIYTETEPSEEFKPFFK